MCQYFLFCFLTKIVNINLLALTKVSTINIFKHLFFLLNLLCLSLFSLGEWHHILERKVAEHFLTPFCGRHFIVIAVKTALWVMTSCQNQNHKWVTFVKDGKKKEVETKANKKVIKMIERCYCFDILCQEYQIYGF